MTSTSVRGQIFQNFCARIQTITAANGYAFNVRQVYFDKIPMGITLTAYQLPAIFIIDRQDTLVMQQNTVEGSFEVKMQLWNVLVGDVTMHEYVRDVFKCIYANNPSAETNSEFRSIHPNIVEVVPNFIASDLQMIDANRIYELSFLIKYRTKLYNM